MPSSTNNTASTSMGNFGNGQVDRSEATTTTRRQQRQQRRQTLRNQSEIAPFMGMDLGDGESGKKTGAKDEKKEKAQNLTDDFSHGKPHDDNLYEKTPNLSGLNPSVYRTPPAGESEFPSTDDEWWKKKLWGISGRKWMFPGFT
ncbi:hypothetical protein FSARC_6756 [Fusarium sarcochroum]|uniref:Uncharacterized protein n=1 Tax=Fusarium sarcochroum TaxID=1208366 RepID=A0A8H4TX18_9HYPO|nr:hypothetical protein FSARC_6756 [Fusarium sarcochroum]